MPAIYFNYLTVNGLHCLNDVLVSIHQLSNQTERKIMIRKDYPAIEKPTQVELEDLPNYPLMTITP